MDPRTDAAQGNLPISAVSHLLQIPVPTIRSWERRHGFPAPARTRGQHRRYSLEEVEQLRALRDTIIQGHAPKDAVAIVRAEAALLPEARPRVDGLLRAATALDPNALRRGLDEAADALGIEDAIVQVALPALQELGTRWRAGVCDVANEHLMTDAVRAWLTRWATLEATPTRTGDVVLSCGPKELHTVGLEAFAVLLRRRHLPTVMLGALTPVDSLRSAVADSGAVAAVVVAQRGVNRKSTVESIAACHGLLGARAFFAGSAFSSAPARRGVPGVYLGTDLVGAAGTVDAAIEAV